MDSDLSQAAADEIFYPFGWVEANGGTLPYIEPGPMWQALFNDLASNTPVPVIAARFHRGLAKALVDVVVALSTADGDRVTDRVALTGGVLQNCTLLELVCELLMGRGYTPLTHRLVPANDGGIALGQAVVAAARRLRDP